MTMTPAEMVLATEKEPENTQTTAYFSLEPTAPTVSPAQEKTPGWAEQTSVSTSLKLSMAMKHLQEPTLHLPEKSQTTPSLSPEPASSTISTAQKKTSDWTEESISTSTKLSLEMEDLQPVASTPISATDWTTTTSLNLSLTETLSVPEENSPPSSVGLNDIIPTHEPTLASKPDLQSTLLRSSQQPAIQQAFLQPRSRNTGVQPQPKSVAMPSYSIVRQGQYCDDKVDVKGGTIQWPEERSSGSVLKYICPVGTYAYPVNWRVCVRGRWTLLRNAYGDSDTVVTCKPVTCVSPRAPEFGALTPHHHVFRWNDTIEFSCYSGFVLLGSAQSTCQVNGRWSGKLPVCDHKDNFCSNPGVPFGGSRSGDFFKEGSVVKYTCDSKLVLRGSSERKCLLTGVWSGEEPQCQSWYTFDNVEDLTKEIQMVRSQIFKSEQKTNERELNPLSGTTHHILFLLDSSVTVGWYNFQQGLKFIDSTIDVIWTHKVSIQVICYDNFKAERIDVMENPMTGRPDPLADSIHYSGFSQHYGTNIYRALDAVLKSVQRAQANRVKWTIFLIAKQSSSGPSPSKMMQEIVKHIPEPDIYLDVFAIGLGSVDRVQLESIIPQKSVEEWGRQYTFYLPSYDTLRLVYSESKWDDDTASSKCGVRMKIRHRSVGRIFGGVKSLEADWPWQVYVSNEKERKLTCAGSIISRRWILSAAHCFSPDLPATSITVGLGMINKDMSSAKTVGVKQLILHPQYNKDYDYDMALLELAQEISYSDTVRPVCLPCTQDVQNLIPSPVGVWQDTCSYQENKMTNAGYYDSGRDLSGYVAGWGLSRQSGIPSYELLYANVSIYPRAQCPKTNHMLTERMFCARGENSDSCKGDSGGAFVMKRKDQWIQIGIVSYGKDLVCGKNNFMGYYSNVPSMMSFIRNRVTDLQYE